MLVYKALTFFCRCTSESHNMRKNNLRHSLVVGSALLVFATLPLVSCNSSISNYATVRLSVETLEMKVGDVQQIGVTVSKGYSGELDWVSTNESVVVIRQPYAYAVGVGEATIKVYFGGGRAECKVSVTDGERSSTTYTPTSAPTSDPTSTPTSTPTSGPAPTTSGEPTSSPTSGEPTSEPTSSPTSEPTPTTSGTPSQPDIAVKSDLKIGSEYSISVGAPKNQVQWMKLILQEFNILTQSAVNFTVTEFEEGDGTSKLPNAEAAPSVFPYASDQTLSFYQLGALSAVGKTDSNWIKKNMGEDAYNAAKLQSVVGYPFTSDNGSVMFYDKSVVTDPSQIDTLDELFALADERGLEVNLPYSNGFYGGAILQTYNQGKSLYTLTPTPTSYTSTSNFASDVGLQGAKLLNRIINEPSVRTVTTAPGSEDVLATIVDVSNVAYFKELMGEKYATAPLPWVEDGVRLGSYLGYKFYGINNTLSAANKTVASYVAKFLCSEYVQMKRFDSFAAKPTLTSLDSYAVGESHIESLKEQAQNHGTILLTACGSELWSETMATATSIKALKTKEPADADLMDILTTLDAGLKK